MAVPSRTDRSGSSRYPDGQLSSMFCRTVSSESGPSCMYFTMPVQNEPEPTSGGIWSEASKPPARRWRRQCIREQHRRVGQDRVGVAILPDVDVRREPRQARVAAHRHWNSSPLNLSRKSLISGECGTRPRSPPRTDRPAGRSGERERAVVFAELRAFREEGEMNVAWRCRQQPGGMSKNGAAHHGTRSKELLAAIEHLSVVEHHVGEDLHRVLTAGSLNGISFLVHLRRRVRALGGAA